MIDASQHMLADVLKLLIKPLEVQLSNLDEEGKVGQSIYSNIFLVLYHLSV